MVAVIAAVGRSILSTAPGNRPGMLAPGTAANAVLLSLQTKKLSVAPGRVTADATEFCKLFTIAILLSAGLDTSVRSCLGLSAIIPGSVTLAVRDARATV